jgi:hypothetical protein
VSNKAWLFLIDRYPSYCLAQNRSFGLVQDLSSYQKLVGKTLPEILRGVVQKTEEIMWCFGNTSLGFFFRPEASAPWMAKGEALCSLSHGGRAPERKQKA